MRPRPRSSGRRTASVASIAAALIAAASYTHSGHGATQVADSFQALMHAAMSRMNATMMAPTTGDPDRDFATMMIPHHQGAIEMAEAELRFGHDPVLRRLAQGIIVEQGQEIAAMHQALDALPPAPAVTSIPTRPAHQH